MDKKNVGTSKGDGSAARKNAPLSVLEERIGWVQKIGWWIAGFYALAFGGFAAWYLPKQLESSRNLTKMDIESTVGPMRVDIAKIAERLSKQTAFNLQSLIPSVELARTLDPAVLKARFQEADSLINTAIAERIPATPALLKEAQMKLRTTILDERLPSDVRSVATTTLVGFEAYNVFSSTVVVVNAPKILINQEGTVYAPVTVGKSIWFEGTGKDGATVTVDFTGTHPTFPHPAAFVIASGDAVLSKMRVRGKDSAPSFLIVSSGQSRVLVSEAKSPAQGVELHLSGMLQKPRTQRSQRLEPPCRTFARFPAQRRSEACVLQGKVRASLIQTTCLRSDRDPLHRLYRRLRVKDGSATRSFSGDLWPLVRSRLPGQVADPSRFPTA